jgi:putative acetyltransferase
MQDLLIRDEGPSDAAAIDALLRVVFAGDDEAALVARLRAGGEIVASLVAEADGQITGHAAFSRAGIEVDGQRLDAAWLAPVAVVAEHQAKGIGSAMIRQGLRRCGAKGFGYAVVVGNPDYYFRFGFGPATGLQSRWAGDALMVAPLGGAKPGAPVGTLVEPRAFAELE